jgi:hypothetical protein
MNHSYFEIKRFVGVGYIMIISFIFGIVGDLANDWLGVILFMLFPITWSSIINIMKHNKELSSKEENKGEWSKVENKK